MEVSQAERDVIARARLSCTNAAQCTGKCNLEQSCAMHQTAGATLFLINRPVLI